MEAAKFDFVAHLARQAAWSKETFGPGPRTEGVSDHIRKELLEIAADPTDLAEWIDVVILALDGAWRCGGSPEQIIAGIVAKQTKNEGRNWPDWRTADPTKAIEHDRSGESAAAPQVVAGERAAFDAWWNGRVRQSGDRLHATEFAYAIWSAARASAPVQAQEPVAIAAKRLLACVNERKDAEISFTTAEGHTEYDRARHQLQKALSAPVQPVAVPDGTITLTGHQLRMALDLISPGIPWDRDELDDDLTFGIRQHEDDDGKVSTGMCCWNDDTDGVLPLDGEYEAPAAPAAQGDAKELTDDEIVQAVRSVGVDTHPSKFGFSEEQIEGMSVTVLRQVIAAIAAKAAS